MTKSCINSRREHPVRLVCWHHKVALCELENNAQEASVHRSTGGIPGFIILGFGGATDRLWMVIVGAVLFAVAFLATAYGTGAVLSSDSPKSTTVDDSRADEDSP